MSSLWHLIAFVAAHSRMAQLAKRGYPWRVVEQEADHWVELLYDLGTWTNQLPLPGVFMVPYRKTFSPF